MCGWCLNITAHVFIALLYKIPPFICKTTTYSISSSTFLQIQTHIHSLFDFWSIIEAGGRDLSASFRNLEETDESWRFLLIVYCYFGKPPTLQRRPERVPLVGRHTVSCSETLQQSLSHCDERWENLGSWWTEMIACTPDDTHTPLQYKPDCLPKIRKSNIEI